MSCDPLPLSNPLAPACWDPALVEAARRQVQPLLTALAAGLNLAPRQALLLTLGVIGDRGTYPALLAPGETRGPLWDLLAELLGGEDPLLFDPQEWGAWLAPLSGDQIAHAQSAGYPSLYSSLAADGWEAAAEALAAATDHTVGAALWTLAKVLCEGWGVPPPPPSGARAGLFAPRVGRQGTGVPQFQQKM